MSALPRRTLIRMRPRRDATIPVSHVEQSLTVTGNLDTEGEIHVRGSVFGQIRADRLVVAAGGAVEGDVVAREVHIYGRVNGRVFAVNVTVDTSADVKGRIFHHTIAIAKGARVEARMPWRPLNFFETLEQLPETQP